MQKALQLTNVTKSFDGGKTVVLNDVSLTVNKGDFMSIVGTSGSGKSTLLTILGGIDKPSSGQVLLFDKDTDNPSESDKIESNQGIDKSINKDIYNQSAKDKQSNAKDIAALKEKDLAVLRRSRIGFVFQFFNLAPSLTALENIMLPIVLSKKKQKDFKQKALELMDYLKILEHKDKLPSKMSGGEQQRVAIARCMVFSPEIMLLDEPTGNLDSTSSGEIMQLLKSINQDFNTTIVMVTHSMACAGYGNKIISIIDGKIVVKD